LIEFLERLDYHLAITFIVLFFIVALFFYFYVIYPNVKIKVDSSVANVKNRLACKKVQEEAVRNSWTIYIWAYPKRIVLLNIAFVIVFFFSVLLYFLTGIWFHLIVFVAYVVFLKFLYKWYEEFPKIAAEKLKKHEEKLESDLKNQIKSLADKVEEVLSNEEEIKNTPLEYLAHLKIDIIKHPTDVQKFDFPPFIDLPPAKKSVIKARKMQYFVLTRDFIYAALDPTPFNLLEPKRGDIKKKCTEIIAVGPTRDYYYSMIRRVYYDKDEKGIKIIFFDDEAEKPVVMKAPEPAAKESIFKIKERLRLLERQRLGKVDEIYKFYAIKDALKVSIEDIKKSLLEQQKLQEQESSTEQKEEEQEDKK